MSAFAQAWPCFSIESLFCTLDDLILQRLAQIAEMIAVSGDPDDQICMLLRVQLRIDQCLSVDHIELNVVPVHIEICPDQIGHLFQPFLSFKDIWSKLLIQQRPAGLQMIHLGR